VVGNRSSEAVVQARREQILERVLELGEIPIAELARSHAVSEMTVHRDLDALAGAGFLSKHRGRAVAPSALTVQTSAVFRLRAARQLKEAVARAALGLLGTPRSVLVDDSTSVLPLLRMLGEKASRPVTVVSNYLEVLRLTAACPMLNAHLLGGEYVPELDATFGSATLDAISGWDIDVAVLSAPAVQQGRCYHALQASAALKQAALDVSARSILLLDHTKMPRTAPHVMCDVARFSAVVTDDETDPREIAAMRASGAQVVLAPTTSSSSSSGRNARN
jgi:DeoR/GlpR family transcriptional regulator of sugar metabolism